MYTHSRSRVIKFLPVSQKRVESINVTDEIVGLQLPIKIQSYEIMRPVEELSEKFLRP